MSNGLIHLKSLLPLRKTFTLSPSGGVWISNGVAIYLSYSSIDIDVNNIGHLCSLYSFLEHHASDLGMLSQPPVGFTIQGES